VVIEVQKFLILILIIFDQIIKKLQKSKMKERMAD